MILLSVQNLTCTQAAKTLFENISFGIEEGEKVALIGINGSGKSTLLHTIIELSQEKTNTLTTKQGLKLTYLPQLPVFNPEDTILDHLFKSDSATANLIRQYHRCLENPSAHDQLDALIAQMDHQQAWEYESRVTSILNELDIHTLSQPMKNLSGGMIKKISLAQIFFEDTDLLIMDEPTNHLDIDTISWLETMLKRINTTLLMVTHDRYFLDKICTKILEIDQKTLYSYKGNYQAFLEQKDLRMISQQKSEENIQAIMRVELEWLKRGPKARSTKQKARKQRIEGLQNREVFTPEVEIEIGVAGRRLGKKILELKNINKAFEDRPIISDFSYQFKHGEKLGIVGPNGSGKTTLFNLISERILPDSGEVDRGINTVFGYFDQHSHALNKNITIIEHVKQIGEFITLHDGTQLSASKLLEKFLFSSQMFKTKIGDLSGGERRRLDLVCMLLSNPNFLLFDEPTNDLDIATLSILEDFLLKFNGCVMIISHDRYFMDRVVDQLLVFKPNGKLTHFTGSYTDYAQEKKSQEKLIKLEKWIHQPKKINQTESHELKKIESEIEKLEKESANLSAEFLNINSTPEEYAKYGKKLKEIESELTAKLLRWETLASL